MKGVLRGKQHRESNLISSSDLYGVDISAYIERSVPWRIIMKQRITYIRGADQNFDPASIAPTGGSLKIPSLRAAKEHKLTIDVSELPEEVLLSVYTAGGHGEG